jgi:hypothetical protein
VIFDVLRQRFAVIDKLFQLGVGDIAGHDNSAAQATGGYRTATAAPGSRSSAG